MKRSRPKTLKVVQVRSKAPEADGFNEVVSMIQASQYRALQAVNTELIDLYWRVGEYISRKIESAAWGEGVVKNLAAHIAHHHPDIKGSTPSPHAADSILRLMYSPTRQ